MARTRPHFKLHTAILHHEKMVGLVRDNELFGLYAKLGILAIDRYASKNNNTFSVSHAELLGLTNRKRIDKALLILGKVVDTSPLTISYHTHSVSITFPNLLEKQGFHQENEPRTSAPYTYTNTETYTYKDKDINVAGAGAMNEQEVASMIDVRPGGVVYTAREVLAWVKWISPQIAMRKPENHKGMMFSWWVRANRKAVDDALAWCAVSNERKLEVVKEVDVSEVPDDLFHDTEGGGF